MVTTTVQRPKRDRVDIAVNILLALFGLCLLIFAIWLRFSPTGKDIYQGYMLLLILFFQVKEVSISVFAAVIGGIGGLCLFVASWLERRQRRALRKLQ